MSRLPCDSQGSGRRRAGLTLLELIVALGILAILSTVAVRSLDPLADQARYEATQQVLTQLRNATVGDRAAKQINGQRIITGYVADTGQLPADLVDFSSQPAGIIAHAAQTFDSDRDGQVDVTLTSGWNGPYVQLGVGASSLLDGWGRAPLIDPDGGSFDFLSYGSDSDSLPPEDGYRADLSVTIPASEYSATVVFRLFDVDENSGLRIDPAPTGTEQLGVLLYCVNGSGGTTGAIQEVMLPVASSGTFEASKANVAHGTAAARGLLWLDTDADSQFDAGETVVRSSYVHYFTVVGGTVGRVEMELR